VHRHDQHEPVCLSNTERVGASERERNSECNADTNCHGLGLANAISDTVSFTKRDRDHVSDAEPVAGGRDTDGVAERESESVGLADLTQGRVL